MMKISQVMNSWCKCHSSMLKIMSEIVFHVMNILKYQHNYLWLMRKYLRSFLHNINNYLHENYRLIFKFVYSTLKCFINFLISEQKRHQIVIIEVNVNQSEKCSKTTSLWISMCISSRKLSRSFHAKDLFLWFKLTKLNW
jgi:hypothetical protein